MRHLLEVLWFFSICGLSVVGGQGIEGLFKGELRWWFNTGWSESSWALSMYLIIDRCEGALCGTVRLEETPPIWQEKELGMDFPLPVIPQSSLFKPPSNIQVDVFPLYLDRNNLSFSFSYEDPITWLDIDVEMTLRFVDRIVFGSAKGSFLGGKSMSGIVFLKKTEEREVIGKRHIISK